MSMSGSWLFVVASEAISVGNTTVMLPGMGSYIAVAIMGSYIAVAIEQRSLVAVGWAIGTMLVVILVYDQLLFRPLVAWADRFRFEQEAGMTSPKSWVLSILRRSGVIAKLGHPLSAVWRLSYTTSLFGGGKRVAIVRPQDSQRWGDRVWTAIVVAAAAVALWQVGRFVLEGVSLVDVGKAILLGLATLTRVYHSHRDCEPDLGAHRSLGWNACTRDPYRSAGRSVPGSLSREPFVSNCRIGDLSADFSHC